LPPATYLNRGVSFSLKKHGAKLMCNYNRSQKYDKSFLSQNFMGPNAILMLDEITQDIELTMDMRVLDLGCGKGLTAIFLAKEYGAKTFAVDLWISATDNYKRFLQMGVDDLVVPIHADASIELPFAAEYFDALISVDSYHYYGNNDDYFERHLKSLIKKGAPVAIAIPGTKYEMNGIIPDGLAPFLDDEGFATLHCIEWWTQILEKHLDNFSIKEMACSDAAWSDWLAADNPIAKQDINMIKADNGKYLNLIAVTGNVK
jgi:cyclopropane fatty-acyl-phospholipid synthase-like methyltransferase